MLVGAVKDSGVNDRGVESYESDERVMMGGSRHDHSSWVFVVAFAAWHFPITRSRGTITISECSPPLQKNTQLLQALAKPERRVVVTTCEPPHVGWKSIDDHGPGCPNQRKKESTGACVRNIGCSLWKEREKEPAR